MILFLSPPARRPAPELKLEKMAIFSAPCDVLHIATFLRFGAMCDVHSRPFPGLEYLIKIQGRNT